MKRYLLTTTFSLVTYLNITCDNHHINCADVRRGRFLYHSSITNTDYLIERNDTIQTEIDTHSKIITRCKIVWVNDCEYYLTITQNNNPNRDGIDSFFESTPIKTSIVQVTSSYYIFSSKVDSIGKSLTLTDTMKILKWGDPFHFPRL